MRQFHFVDHVRGVVPLCTVYQCFPGATNFTYANVRTLGRLTKEHRLVTFPGPESVYSASLPGLERVIGCVYLSTQAVVKFQVSWVGFSFNFCSKVMLLALLMVKINLLQAHRAVCAFLFSVCSLSVCWQCYVITVAAAAAAAAAVSAAAGRHLWCFGRLMWRYQSRLRHVISPAHGGCPRLPRPLRSPPLLILPPCYLVSLRELDIFAYTLQCYTFRFWYSLLRCGDPRDSSIKTEND